LEAEEGSISVGGVDISLLGLHKLRTSMSVIPQSPVLFSGCTVRENLDPFGNCDDAAIGRALTAVQISETIHSLPKGLDAPVAEGGANFSVGQRQLLCLARAILLQNKILVLDEPTANVDMRTDQLLQQTLKEDFFADATIFSVAHRLDTIMDYDKVLVLGDGKVLEYGSPNELLLAKHKGGEKGFFASMVDSTGETMAKLLASKAIAASRHSDSNGLE
jgi:ATP-binding cassette subfamily C (CFTR/MRP) protein 4